MAAVAVGTVLQTMAKTTGIIGMVAGMGTTDMGMDTSAFSLVYRSLRRFCHHRPFMSLLLLK